MSFLRLILVGVWTSVVQLKTVLPFHYKIGELEVLHKCSNTRECSCLAEVMCS